MTTISKTAGQPWSHGGYAARSVAANAKISIAEMNPPTDPMPMPKAIATARASGDCPAGFSS
jgi:hypothetical protein